MNITIKNEQKKRFPKGIMVCFGINGLFMAGLSMINALLVLYLTQKMHVNTKEAYSIYAAFGSLFYSAALFGGYLGGRFDHKLTAIMGGVLAGGGSYFIAVPTIHSILFGLSCFIIGGGMLVPNINCLTGKLFAKTDSMRDSGFTFVYIGMNIGGFLASISSGFIARYFGFSIAYVISSTSVLCAMLLLVFGYRRLEFHSDPQVIPYKPKVTLQNFIPLLVCVLIAVPVITLLLHHAKISNTLLIIVGLIMASVVFMIAKKEKNPEARKKLYGFLIFSVFGLAFWALYMLAPSLLTIFINNNVNRHVGGFVIPTASAYALNPFFIITLGALTTLYFFRKSLKGETLPLRNKFAFGIISMGAGYLILTLAIKLAGSGGYTFFYWIVISYFLQTLGELFIGPIGFAMVGSLVPTQLEGMMMGFWQLATGVAGAISGFLASATVTAPHITNPKVTNPTFAHFFALYGGITIGVGIVIILLKNQFKKLWV
jgi:proton-dependent oligopeptide transporter, POT family